MEMERSDDRDKLATDDDVNVLSGDNKVDVDITPDLQNIRVQICSCSIIFNCFSKLKKTKKRCNYSNPLIANKKGDISVAFFVVSLPSQTIDATIMR